MLRLVYSRVELAGCTLVHAVVQYAVVYPVSHFVEPVADRFGFALLVGQEYVGQFIVQRFGLFVVVVLSVEPFIRTFGIGDLPAGCKGIFLFLRYGFPLGFVSCFKIRFLFVYDGKTLPVFAFGQRESLFLSVPHYSGSGVFEFYLCL